MAIVSLWWALLVTKGSRAGLDARGVTAAGWALPAVPSWFQWGGGCAVQRKVLTTPCLGFAFQVAQMSRALHWIMKALRDGGFGSEEGLPTLGEWRPRPRLVSTGLCSFESGGPWGGEAVSRAPPRPGGGLTELFLSPERPEGA